MKTSIFINNVDYSNYVLDKPSSSCQFEEGYIIGNTPSTELSIKFDNSSGVFDTLLDFKIVLKQDNKQIGIFNIVEKPQRMTSELSLTLNDNMIKTNVLYNTGIAYPCTVKDQLLDMQKILGITINYSCIPQAKQNKVINFYDNTVSIREYLSWIAEMCVCNVFANAMGELEFIALKKTSSHVIEDSDVEKFFKIEDVIISRVKIDNGLLVREKGTDVNNTLYINPSNPYVELQDDIDYIYTQIGGMSFATSKDFKVVSVNNLKLGELVEYKGRFTFIVLNIKEDYLNATYDIQELSGELTIKNMERVKNNIPNDIKIRGLKVKTDQNEAKLEIVAKEQEGTNKKITKIEQDYKGISLSVTETNGKVDTISKDLNGVKDETLKLATVVNDIEIGGRNLVLNTAIPFEVISTEFNKDVIRYPALCPYLRNNKNHIRDRWITLSVDVKTTDLVYGVTKPWVGFQLNINGTTNMWLAIDRSFIPAGTSSGFKRYTKSFKVNDMDITGIGSFVRARDITGTVELVRWKIEIGNKATDWTPAPEDQELTQSPTPPTNKENLWCDTSLKPPMIKRWEGTKWIIVNDYTENISTAKKEVTEEYTSAINIVKNEINQNVSKLDTTVYKFETGSGNIFDNCNQYVSKNSSSTKEIMSYDMPFGLDLDTLRNKDICISTEVFARKSIPKSLLGYMGAEFTITFTDNTTQKIATYFMPSTFYLQYYSESGTNDIDQRIYTHYKVLDKAIKLVSNMKIIIAINGESLRVANPKVEFGVYPTGFEFDMHDMRDSVTTIESNYTKMDMKIDSISLQAVSLTQEVTSIKGDVTTLETRLQSTELKLTPTNITAMVNEKIGSDGSIQTTKVTIDKTGLSVYGGGIAIYNNANQKVFYADGSGNLVSNGTFSNLSGIRKTSLRNGSIEFNENSTLIGYIGTNQLYSDNSKKGLDFDLEYDGSYMTWAYRENPSSSTYTMKWSYASRDIPLYARDRLHAGCDIDMHNHYIRNAYFEDGVITGELVFIQPLAMNTDGTVKRWSTAKLVFKNGLLKAGTWSNQ